MPIYEYCCKDCHQIFEEWRKHIEDNSILHSCPICRGQAERLISNTSFSLKGTGWYVTDYGAYKGKQESGAAEPSAPAPASTAPVASGTGTEKTGASELSSPVATS